MDQSPDSPYLPGSKDYAGDDWTHDGDGDGIADSVEKYLPDCGASPRVCLQNARRLKDIPPGRFGLRAEDLLLWTGDAPRAPELAWAPSEAALRAYTLSSSDSAIVSIRDGRLVAQRPGHVRITVQSPGFPALEAGFTARVVAEGIRLDSLRASDLVLAQDADTLPALTWFPPDATYKDYVLSVEPESVAVTAEGALHGAKPGRAKAIVIAADGRHRAEFSLTVVPPPAVETVLTVAPLFLVVGDAPAAPALAWDPPQAGRSGYRLSLEDTTSVVGLTPNGEEVVPLAPGTARVHVASRSGSAQADFQVTVAARRIAVSGLAADSMVLRLKDGPQAPVLHWLPDDATERGYALAGRDSSIAIPFAGKVRPIAPGRTVFVATAHDGGFAAEFAVTVQADSVPGPDPKPDPDSVPVTGLSVAALFLQVGESKAPVLTWMPAGARAPAYTLVPEDTNVAAAAASDSGPLLVGRHEGSTLVDLRAANGLSAAFRVTVTDHSVPVVSIQAADFSLGLADGPYAPVILFTPSDATDQSYALIAPDAGGSIRIEANKVVPVRPGKSPLRIVPNGNPAAAVTCSATVTARVRSVSAPNDTVLPGGDARSAAARLTWDPPEATDKSFRLSTKDTGIVRIGPDGTTYQGLASGKAKVIVQALDGSGAADTFTVLVRIPVTRIIAKDLTLKATDSLVNPWFLFTFVPDNASNKNWSFLYADSNAVPRPSSVVAIVDNWQLRAVAPGKADLIAYSLDNRAIRDTFTVTVVRAVQALVAASPVSMRVGDPDFRPSVTVLPADASVRTWHLVSANPAVVSVVGTTSIHAVKAGTATVTAVSDENPQITTTLEVQIRSWP